MGRGPARFTWIIACGLLATVFGCGDPGDGSVVVDKVDEADEEAERSPSAERDGAHDALAGEVGRLGEAVRETAGAARDAASEVKALREEVARLRGSLEDTRALTKAAPGGPVVLTPAAAAVVVSAAGQEETPRAAGGGAPSKPERSEDAAKPDDAKPDEAKPDDAKPDDAKPDDAKPATLPRTASREKVDAAVAKAAALCRAFSYAEAVKALDALGGEQAKPLAEEDAKMLAVYGDLVRREGAQFRLVAERIRSGKREGLLGMRDSPTYHNIREINEDGLVLGRRAGATLEFSWERVPGSQQHKLMLDVGADVKSFDERVAVAVFAHHRGLETEREDSLRVAEGLAETDEQKDLVRRARKALAAVGPGRD